ncbi:MAG: H-NS histone family protein [Pseudomonadota bacterium]
MDLSNLSIDELRDLQEQIKRDLKKRQQDDIIKAREQILAIAQSVGIPLKELVSGQIRAKTGSAKEKGREKEKGQMPVRYRHPSDVSLQWSGRGRQPGWVKDWIESGRSLDTLRV